MGETLNEKPMTPLEVQAITHTVLKEYSAEQEKSLPKLMAPLMFEVAEKVAERSEVAVSTLLSNIFGIDVRDKESVGKLQRDLFYLHDRRVESETERKIIKNAVTVGLIKGVGMAIIGGGAALLAFMGLKS